MPESRPLKVCFVALYALPVLEPAEPGQFGGLETRAVILARGLARVRGCDVHFVVQHSASPPRFTDEGITIHTLPLLWLDRVRRSLGRNARLERRFPFLRVRKWSPKLLWQIPVLAAAKPFKRAPTDARRPDEFFRRIDADVYVTFGVSQTSARVIASGAAVGRPAVLMLGSDGDLDAGFRPGAGYTNPYGVTSEVGAFALARATAVVAQTPRQLDLLRERFDRCGFLLNNPFDFGTWDRAFPSVPDTSLTGGLDRYALWIGRTDTFHKRPLVLLDLARMCPEISFLMVLGVTDVATDSDLRRNLPSNVHIIPPVPFARMPEIFSRAAVYVSTGTDTHEGFPNVFLQASASRVPIATLEMDPGYVAATGAGTCACGDLSQLAGSVRIAWNDSETSRRQGERGRAYVSAKHRDDIVVASLHERLTSIRNETVG